MCTALAVRGHDVELATTDRGGDDVVDAVRGPSGGEFAVHVFPVRFLNAWAYSPELASFVRRNVHAVDIVHIHSLYLFPTAVAAAVCRRRGRPYIIRPHGTLNPYQRTRHPWRKSIYELLIERRNLVAAARIHYTSAAERAYAQKAGWTTASVVVPLPVDVEGLASGGVGDDLRSRFPELSATPVVAFLGRLAPTKGVDVLIDAFKLVLVNHPTAHLAIAGPDDYGLGPGLARRVNEHGMADRVTFLGLLDGRDKRELLRSSDVFVLPSHDESFGVSVIEAIAAGVPVVVTPGVAVHAEIAAAEAGFVVERHADAVAAAVSKILAHPRAAAHIGANGQALARQRYSWSAVAEQLENVYEDLIDGQLGGEVMTPDKKVQPC
jgi:glycosyltransferase involved in cell wall biosynthesis